MRSMNRITISYKFKEKINTLKFSSQVQPLPYLVSNSSIHKSLLAFYDAQEPMPMNHIALAAPRELNA
jgi:hypothetical protein